MRAMQPRRWFRLVLLLVALLTGQQAALVHPYSHDGGGAATQEDPHALAGEACDQCVAYAGFASALPGAEYVLPSPAGRPTLNITHPARAVASDLRLSRARDPPLLI